MTFAIVYSHLHTVPHISLFRIIFYFNHHCCIFYHYCQGGPAGGCSLTPPTMSKAFNLLWEQSLNFTIQIIRRNYYSLLVFVQTTILECFLQYIMFIFLPIVRSINIYIFRWTNRLKVRVPKTAGSFDKSFIQ